MDKLRYKTWEWPRNPETWVQEAVREPVYTKNASNVMVFSGMSPVKRTVSGKGVFVGSNAYEDFKALEQLFRDATCGSLIHPVWGEFNMYFTELELTQEPKANYVSYRYTFREADDKNAIPQ